jgi:hypothetical protein
MTARGIVQQIDDSKKGHGKRGPWTLYKVQIDGKWYSAGFDRPQFSPGQTIEFVSENTGKGDNIVKGSVRVVSEDTPLEPQLASPRSTATPAVDTRQLSIVLQHSQEMAERRIANLIAVHALPLSKADTKAGEAKRFEEVQEIARKLTVQFYNDATSDRLLKFVADTPPPAVKAETPVPTPKSTGDDDITGDEE